VRPMLAALILGLTALTGAAHAEQPLTFNRIQLQAQASAQVENDLAVATLVAEAEAETAARSATQVNEAMSWALGEARQVVGVTASTEAYNTRPLYKDGRVQRWHSEQSLRLESSDANLLADLIGTLQGRLNIRGMAFTVSPQQRRQSENMLMERALTAFRERAEIVRQTLGATGYRLVRIDVNSGGGFNPAPRMVARMGMEADMVPVPGVEAGSSEISVTASGEIELIGAPDLP